MVYLIKSFNEFYFLPYNSYKFIILLISKNPGDTMHSQNTSRNPPNYTYGLYEYLYSPLYYIRLHILYKLLWVVDTLFTTSLYISYEYNIYSLILL